MNQTPATWQGKVLYSLILLVLIAIGARVVWELISPMLPALIALSIVICLGWLFFRRR